jgi:hypothetical protein
MQGDEPKMTRGEVRKSAELKPNALNDLALPAKSAVPRNTPPKDPTLERLPNSQAAATLDTKELGLSPKTLLERLQLLPKQEREVLQNFFLEHGYDPTALDLAAMGLDEGLRNLQKLITDLFRPHEHHDGLPLAPDARKKRKRLRADGLEEELSVEDREVDLFAKTLPEKIERFTTPFDHAHLSITTKEDRLKKSTDSRAKRKAALRRKHGRALLKNG